MMRKRLKRFICAALTIWNQVVISRIIQIPIDSEENDTVNTSDIDKTVFTRDYLDLVEKAGIEAKHYFDVSFETLEDNSTMMLVFFIKETDTSLKEGLGV